MSKAHSKNIFKDFFHNIYISFIPNNKDNFKQIAIKIVFIISLCTLIVSSTYLVNYFVNSSQQNSIIDDSRNVWYGKEENYTTEDDRVARMLQENSDFKGWISINNTSVDNPIYQAEDNDYYLTHNQLNQKNACGALFFDCNNEIKEDFTSTNLLIYGHNMKNGSMFGTLKNFKNIDFYKENPTINFSTLYGGGTYKIYSVMILNATKSDDNDYIYNIGCNSFTAAKDFDRWTSEAFERSLIDTGVDVKYGDDIITLVTCTYEFDNARLVIMARKTRDSESSAVDTSNASVNPDVRYPKRWYDDRNLDFPY